MAQAPTRAPARTPVKTAQAAPQTAQNTPAGALVATPASGALALPADLAAELAEHAKEAAAKERPSVSRISLKSGMMNIGGDPVPGNNLDIVIVGGAYRNVYYAGAYDPDNIVNPDCFALADDMDGMAPHENVTSPQGEDCTSCPKAQWGSAMKNGKPSRGKACKQTRRLVVIPANQCESVEDVLGAELAIIDVPVTSVKNYATLVNTLSTTLNLPVWAVVTNVLVRPHARNQFEVVFTPLRAAGDADIIRALQKRRDDAMRIALTPYDGTGGEADPDAETAAPAPDAPAKRKF